jgi:hypothetical protein
MDMNLCRSRAGAHWARSLVVTSALALAFGAAPVGLDLGASGLALVAKPALAKNDGDNGNGGGNGGGNGNAGGNDNAAAAGGNGNGNAGGNGNGNGATNGVGKVGDQGKPGVTGQAKKDDVAADAVAYTFSKKETDALLSKGWAQYPDTYKNHGQFVSTYVHIAKALGYGARDGTLQANFMPLAWYGKQAELRTLEQQLATLDAQIAALQAIINDPLATAQQKLDAAAALALLADPTVLEGQIDALKGELDALANSIPDWKPGHGPQGDTWAYANLDWNGDGVVNQADVDAYEAGEPQATLYLPGAP